MSILPGGRFGLSFIVIALTLLKFRRGRGEEEEFESETESELPQAQERKNSSGEIRLKMVKIGKYTSTNWPINIQMERTPYSRKLKLYNNIDWPF